MPRPETRGRDGRAVRAESRRAQGRDREDLRGSERKFSRSGTGRLPEWRGPRGLWPGTARASVGRVPRSGPVYLRLFVAVAITGGGAAMPRSSAAITEVPPASAVPVPRRAMTLDQALLYAREHQPSLQSALARVSAAAADTRIARAQWLPTFGATAQALEGTTNNSTASYIGVREVAIPRIGGTPVHSTGSFTPSTSTLVAVGAGQEIFDFGRIAAQAAVADVAYEGERYRASAERLRVELLVKDAYFAVHAARAVLRAAEDAYTRARLHRDMAAAAVKSGLHAPIELTRAEADLTRFEVGRIRASGGLDTARVVFAAAVGIDDRTLDVAGDPPPVRAAPALDDGLKLAFDRDPTLQEARARLRGTEAVTRAIAAELRPDLLLSATVSERGGAADPSTGPLSPDYGPLPVVPNWDVGLVFALAPLRPGGRCAAEGGGGAHRRGARGRRRAGAAGDGRRAAGLRGGPDRPGGAGRPPARGGRGARELRAGGGALQGRAGNFAGARGRRGGPDRHGDPARRRELRRAARPGAPGAAVRGRGEMITMTTPDEKPDTPMRRSRRVPITIATGTITVVAIALLMVARASSHVNKVALAGAPKGVTVVEARAAQYRPSRRYVGTIQPWIEAKIGPQPISGYVDTVLVRPGDLVKRGQVIATLDCRNASASSKAVSMQARAIQAQQEAIAHESARVAELKEGGFASPNEIEKHAAESASKAAEVMETQAKMQRATLEVNDCVLRAPFAGEIAIRAADPGAFAHPGTAVATLVDRTTVRIVAEVPEADFDVVAPATPVRIVALATNRELRGTIARRSPAADFSTRTVHLEIDVPDPEPLAARRDHRGDRDGRRRAGGGHRDSSGRGVGARRQGDRLRRRPQRREEGRVSAEGREGRKPVSRSRVAPGQPAS